MSRTCPQCSTSYDEEILHCPEDGTNLTQVEPDDELIGRDIGSYRVTKLLGKGGMGAVYAAEHPVIGSKVAIKFLHPQYAADRKIVDRFFNEARAVNVIGHDNILKILDLNVTEDGRHYFVMEFLLGKPLQKLVEDGNPVPLDVSGPILLQFCEALQAAHSNNIFHRDIKPDNVYLIVHKGRKNFVKVVDFGIAKLAGEGNPGGQTQTGMVMGTPAYMSPEQAGGMTSRIDARSDIYSTGVMMFQLATGKLPFPGQSFGEVLIGHLQLPPPRPRELNPHIPEAYEAVILKALSKKQEERQQSMQELHDEIKAVMDALGISAELPKASEQEMSAITSSVRLKDLQSTPRATRPGTSPGRPGTSPGRPKSTPNATRSSQPTVQEAPQATAYLPPPAAAPKSRLGLFVGLGAAAVLVLGGGVGFAVWKGEQARQQAERLAHEAAERAAKVAAEAAAKAAAEEAKRAAEKAQAESVVPVFVVSDPLDADVVAGWKDAKGVEQTKSGKTPLEVQVPHAAKVHLAFTKPGFLPYGQDVIADTAQQVKVTLTPDKSLAVAKAGLGGDKPKKPKKKGAAANPDSDDTIPVDEF